eukprot:g3996.t1
MPSIDKCDNDAYLSDLDRAIQESLKSMPSSGPLTFEDEAEEEIESGSQIREAKTLNQFHSFFEPSIKEFSSPGAICGMISCANALILCDALKHVPSNHKFTRKDVNDLAVRALKDRARVLKETRRVMRHIRDSRDRYVKANAEKFDDDSKKAVYMRAWVANYEISDYFISEAQRVAPGGKCWANSLFFFRKNQWPERDAASHEEKLRLEEEREFGDKEDGDSYVPFIYETFAPRRELLRPGEWRKRRNHRKVPVFVVDLNGHFCVAVAIYTKEIPRPDGDSDCRLLLLLNTMKTSYVESPSAKNLFLDAFDDPKGNGGG